MLAKYVQKISLSTDYASINITLLYVQFNAFHKSNAMIE